MTVSALVAEEDLNLHQVVHDILEICLKDVEVERAMNAEALMRKLRETEASEDQQFDLVLYDIRFDEMSGGDSLPVLRREMPQLDPRLILLAGNGDDVRRNEHARDLAYVLYPFSLDDFVDTIKRVRSRSEEAEAADGAGNGKDNE